MAVTSVAQPSSQSIVSLRLIIISLLTVVFQSLCQAADTNLTADADARLINEATGLDTKLVATDGWSKLVTGAHGSRISGRLLVYDGAYFTNEFGKLVSCITHNFG